MIKRCLQIVGQASVWWHLELDLSHRRLRNHFHESLLLKDHSLWATDTTVQAESCSRPLILLICKQIVVKNVKWAQLQTSHNIMYDSEYGTMTIQIYKDERVIIDSSSWYCSWGTIRYWDTHIIWLCRKRRFQILLQNTKYKSSFSKVFMSTKFLEVLHISMNGHLPLHLNAFQCDLGIFGDNHSTSFATVIPLCLPCRAVTK